MIFIYYIFFLTKKGARGFVVNLIIWRRFGCFLFGSLLLPVELVRHTMSGCGLGEHCIQDVWFSQFQSPFSASKEKTSNKFRLVVTSAPDLAHVL